VSENYLILGYYDGEIKIIEIKEWNLIKVIHLGVPISSMVLLPNGMLVTSHDRGLIKLIDLDMFKVIQTLYEITDCDISDLLVVGNQLIVCDSKGSIHVLSIHSKEGIFQLIKLPKLIDIKFLFE
jgi:WD40 repeat protein